MSRLAVIALLAACLFQAPPALAKTTRMVPIQPIALPERGGESYPLTAIHDAIIEGSAVNRWRVDSDSPGAVTLSNLVRGKHTVVVTVRYDASNLQVDYVSSANLNFKQRGDKAYIHPSYYLWVSRLAQDIVFSLKYPKTRSDGAGADAGGQSSTSAAAPRTILIGAGGDDQTIVIDSTIPYANDLVADEDLRNDCDWNTTLATRIVEASDGLISAKTKPTDGAQVNRLLISVANVQIPPPPRPTFAVAQAGAGSTAGAGVSGPVFTGPKWINLHGELIHNGELVDTFDLRRTTVRGSYSYKACSIADLIAKTLSTDVASWVQAHVVRP